MIKLHPKLRLLIASCLLIFIWGNSPVYGAALRGVAASGGKTGNNGNFTIKGTAGNIASTGTSTATVQSGFWNKKMTESGCDCNPGEADGNGVINVLDIVYLVNFKFKSGPTPIPYALCSGDANCDCIVNILDIVSLVNYKFKGGEDPCGCSGFAGNCGAP